MTRPLDFLNAVQCVLRNNGQEKLDFSLLIYYEGDCAAWLHDASDKSVKNAAEKMMNALHQREDTLMSDTINGAFICAMKWPGGIVVLVTAGPADTSHILETSIKKLAV